MFDRRKISRIARRLLWLQGLYFLFSGLWPLLHLQSFLIVTGPKHDLWLVQTVGALIAVMGLAMCVAGLRLFVTAEACALAAGSALALLLVDVVFTAEQVISPIYLADALLECAFLIAWITLGWLLLKVHRLEGSPLPTHLATAWR